MPLSQALQYAGAVHALAQSLADRVADAADGPHVPVPDLGSAVVVDQLRVVVYDAAVAEMSDGLEDELAGLRRTLP